MKDINTFLTINQLAKVCSISRASLLRMEADGILEPAYINPNNGYRFYDSANVLRVTRNITLQEFGFTHKELYECYNSSDSYNKLLNKLQSKLAVMEYQIANIKLQLKYNEHLSMNRFLFPDVWCYTHKIQNVTDPSLVRPYIWETFNEVISKGYSIDNNMHPFVQADYQKMANHHYQNDGYDYEVCIPVIPGKERESLKYFAASETLSVILYGGSADMPLAFEKIMTEIKTNNLKTNGQARIIASVNSFPGEEIPLEHWVMQVCAPVCS